MSSNKNLTKHGAAKRLRTSPRSSGAPSSPEKDFTWSDMKAYLDDFLGKMNDRFSCIENKITSQSSRMETRFDELMNTVAYQGKEIEELSEKMKYVEEESQIIKNDLLGEIDRLSAYVARENLVFLGISENRKDENTKEVLNKFLVEKLKLKEEQVGNIEYQRVHRVPTTQTPRPIKARFLRFSDKTLIQSNAKLLKGTNMFVVPDLPKRVREERRAQTSALRAARQAGKLAFFSNAEPTKLMVNGRWILRAEQDKLVKIWEKSASEGGARKKENRQERRKFSQKRAEQAGSERRISEEKDGQDPGDRTNLDATMESGDADAGDEECLGAVGGKEL